MKQDLVFVVCSFALCKKRKREREKKKDKKKRLEDGLEEINCRVLMFIGGESECFEKGLTGQPVMPM